MRLRLRDYWLMFIPLVALVVLLIAGVAYSILMK